MRINLSFLVKISFLRIISRVLTYFLTLGRAQDFVIGTFLPLNSVAGSQMAASFSAVNSIMCPRQINYCSGEKGRGVSSTRMTYKTTVSKRSSTFYPFIRLI